MELEDRLRDYNLSHSLGVLQESSHSEKTSADDNSENISVQLLVEKLLDEIKDQDTEADDELSVGTYSTV